MCVYLFRGGSRSIFGIIYLYVGVCVCIYMCVYVFDGVAPGRFLVLVDICVCMEGSVYVYDIYDICICTSIHPS